jgi:hypothetical protein
MTDKGNWAQQEFRTVDLGDKRLDRRLVEVVANLAAAPRESIPTASEGWAETQAAYRLFRNEKVTAEKILRPHVEETMRRIAKLPVALVLQDTTDLDYSAKKNKLKDAGPINRESDVGILLHPQLVVTPEGIHQGILDAEMWTRDETSKKKRLAVGVTGIASQPGSPRHVAKRRWSASATASPISTNFCWKRRRIRWKTCIS